MLTWLVTAKRPRPARSASPRSRAKPRRAGGPASGDAERRDACRARAGAGAPARAAKHHQVGRLGADVLLMEVLPRLCCPGLDALMASSVAPRLVLSPQRERLWVVDERGADAGTLDWCPVCGGELPWHGRAGSPVEPAHRASMAQPVADVTIGARFTVQAPALCHRLVLERDPQDFTCRVALWLGRDREPLGDAAGRPHADAAVPLSTGSWPIEAVSPDSPRRSGPTNRSCALPDRRRLSCAA